MSGGDINATEMIASLINQKENLIEGIQYALESVDGSVSILLMNEKGIYAARDKYGRTPVVIGKKRMRSAFLLKILRTGILDIKITKSLARVRLQ